MVATSLVKGTLASLAVTGGCTGAFGSPSHVTKQRVRNMPHMPDLYQKDPVPFVILLLENITTELIRHRITLTAFLQSEIN